MKTDIFCRMIIAVLLFVAVFLTVPNVYLTNADNKAESGSLEQPADADIDERTGLEGLKVYYIDIGQGDATLVTCGGEAMLIDCGGNDNGTKLQLFLKKQGISRLKYLIGTHMDSDHIGGMDVILTKFNCDIVMYPQSGKDSVSYRDVIETMKYRQYTNTLPEVGKSYGLGDAEFTVISPNTDYKDNYNNSSIGLILKHGDKKFLFTGDAEKEGEADILSNGINISCDVYKTGHHGSSSSTTDELLDAANPSYAVISCGMDNPYGHPNDDVLERLYARNIKIYRTDEQGTILAVSDGSQVELLLLGEDSPSITYVLNTETNKFHVPTCKKLPIYNREDVCLSREGLIENGYMPCKRCNP